MESNNPDQVSQPPTRWHLLRDVFVFQFKLMMDGVRDMLLSPVSIIAALLGFVLGGKDPGQYFYRLMHFGRDTDRWINLFGAHDDDSTGVDRAVRRAEAALREECEKGGVVGQLKDSADSVIDSLRP